MSSTTLKLKFQMGRSKFEKGGGAVGGGGRSYIATCKREDNFFLILCFGIC